MFGFFFPFYNSHQIFAWHFESSSLVASRTVPENENNEISGGSETAEPSNAPLSTLSDYLLLNVMPRIGIISHTSAARKVFFQIFDDINCWM